MVKIFLLAIFLHLELFASDLSVNYRDHIEPIVQNQCASCHKGPYLDLRKFPFFSDMFPTQEKLVEEMIRRAKLNDLKRMPPVNYAPLSPDEVTLLEQWLANGLLE